MTVEDAATRPPFVANPGPRSHTAPGSVEPLSSVGPC
jgi:hypothetical protein